MSIKRRYHLIYAQKVLEGESVSSRFPRYHGGAGPVQTRKQGMLPRFELLWLEEIDHLKSSFEPAEEVKAPNFSPSVWTCIHG